MNFVKQTSTESPSESLTAFSLSKAFFLLGSIFLGNWLVNDFVHLPGGFLGFIALGAGAWWFVKSQKGVFEAPSTVKGWIQRCYEVLDQFKTLEEEGNHLNQRKQRVSTLQKIIERSLPQKLSFASTSTSGIAIPGKEEIKSALSVSENLKLTWETSLPTRNESWSLPQVLIEQDLIVYMLPLPLRAADLLWLQKVPIDQPSWVMVSWKDSSTWSDELKDLQAQLPERWNSKILKWNGSDEDLDSVLNPVRRVLEHSQKNIDVTRQRLLSRLHSSWQSELEKLRREKYRNIQNRSQWIVAGAVFASPVPSTDLLSVAVVNGLMIQEMSSIWSCKIRPELLQVVAKQLACAALAQGVVEWSGQALLGIAKLDGSSWVAAGTVQALSAAYLTRVVGRSMADWMALNNGVLEPDLQLLKQQAPQLVSKAAELERVNWLAFLNQGKDWVANQVKESNFLEA
tara:strand:- start:4906 stop:6276 length:1371 start_codon:yes stop_codon:yes gene_type:complete